jgi:hypothetical protein
MRSKLSFILFITFLTLCRILGDLTAEKFNLGYSMVLSLIYFFILEIIYTKIEYMIYKKKTIELSNYYLKFFIYITLSVIFANVISFIFNLEKYQHLLFDLHSSDFYFVDYISILILLIIVLIEVAYKKIKKQSKKNQAI